MAARRTLLSSGGTIQELLQVDRAGGGSRDLHEGDRFGRGAILARLDTADSQRDRAIAAEKVAQTEAKEASSQADAVNAQKEYERALKLSNASSISTSDLDAAYAKYRTTGANLKSANREVEGARVQLAQSDANLSYCTLTMPYQMGTIATRYVEANERVTPGQKAFQVIDLTSVRIAFGVSDNLIGRLSIGDRVTVTTDALPDDRFQAVISKIAPTVDSQTRTYLIEVRVNEPRGLRPGMVATVSLSDEKKAILLPLNAITREAASGRLVAYKVVRNGDKWLAKPFPVELDGVMDHRVTIRNSTQGGLRPGDEVVVAGSPRLYDGATVTVLGDSTKSSTEGTR